MTPVSEAIVSAARALEARLNPWHGEIAVAVREAEATRAVVPEHHSTFRAEKVAAAISAAPWEALASVEDVWNALRDGIDPALHELRADPYAPPQPLTRSTLDATLGDWFATTQRSVTTAERAALERSLAAAGCMLRGGFEAMTTRNLPLRLALVTGSAVVVVVLYVGDGP